MSQIHPIIAASLAHWMPKEAAAQQTRAQPAIETVAPMADQLRDEYASGLDASPPGRDWEPEQ